MGIRSILEQNMETDILDLGDKGLGCKDTFGFYRDNGKEHGNYYIIIEFVYCGYSRKSRKILHGDDIPAFSTLPRTRKVMAPQYS